MSLRGALPRTRWAMSPGAIAALLALVAFVFPAAARATTTFHSCFGRSDIQCGRVYVPFDHSGVVKGDLPLYVERMRTAGPNTGAMFALAGGPGQAATPFLGDFRLALDPALRGRELVVFDQRGTGNSNELFCPGLGSGKLPGKGVWRCARALGAIRAFFSTSESVDDLDAVRRAMGVDRIDLYGVSYGTKVALDYAIRYPEHVDRLVLDSVVMPAALDPYELSSFQAVPRILGQICARDACEGITQDPTADLGHLVTVLEGTKLHGFVVNGHGRRRRANLTRTGILNVLFEGDFDPVLRADFPAAVRAALGGDTAPLLRLSALVAGAEDLTGPDSEALFTATTCEDAALQWDQAGSPAERLGQARAGFGQIPASTYAPFDGGTVFSFSLAPQCAYWPEAGPNPPVDENPLPAVRTLILSGDDDLRTPEEDATKLAGELPAASLVHVPSTGHSVLGSDIFGCATRSLQRFFQGTATAPCVDHGELLAPSPVPPRALSQFRRIAHLPARVGRTLGAVRYTLADAFEYALEGLFQSPDGNKLLPIGGLRGGYLGGTFKTIRLHAYSWVPGVTLTGGVPLRGTATIRVGGHAAARGVLRISDHGVVRGRLGGQKVHARFDASGVVASAADVNAPWALRLRRFAALAGGLPLPR